MQEIDSECNTEKEVENICEENSHADLNKKIQNERIKGKDEFSELMKDRTVQSQEEQFPGRRIIYAHLGTK